MPCCRKVLNLAKINLTWTFLQGPMLPYQGWNNNSKGDKFLFAQIVMKNKMTSVSFKYKSSLLTKPTTWTQDSYLRWAEVMFALHTDTRHSVILDFKVDFWIHTLRDVSWNCISDLWCLLQSQSLLDYFAAMLILYGVTSNSLSHVQLKVHVKTAFFKIWHESLLFFVTMLCQFTKIHAILLQMDFI